MILFSLDLYKTCMKRNGRKVPIRDILVSDCSAEVSVVSAPGIKPGTYSLGLAVSRLLPTAITRAKLLQPLRFRPIIL